MMLKLAHVLAPLGLPPSKQIPLLQERLTFSRLSPTLGFGISSKLWDHFFHTLTPEEPHPKTQ